LPLSIAIDKINPGEEETRHKDITFTTEGLHQIRVEIGEDSLSVDNARHLSINIPKQNYVLIVTNDTVGDAAFALEAALAPSLELTGIATNVIQADFLESELEDKGLSQFRAIYMLGVPSIPAKPLELLESYVRSGGGLVWFLGDKINVDAYNRMSHLVPGETGELEQETDEEGNEIEALFPVYLSNTPGVLERDATTTTPDLNFKSHPVFDDTFNKANNLVSVVRVTGFQPVSEEWEEDDRQRNDGVSTVGYTREGHPLVFDHRFGKGRVMTFLTSAGPPWNNLIEIGGIYAPLVQYLQLYVAKPDEEKHEHAIGDVFERTFPALDYENTINWLHPTIGLQEFSMEHPLKEAAEGEAPAEGDGEAEENSPPATELDTTLWVTRYNGLTVPGVYHYKLIPKSSGQGTQRAVWEFACNVAPEEGESAIASDDTIREHLSPETRVAIHAYGDEGFIAPGTDPGQEVRKYLMYILLFLFVAEQAMAYRLSYHPEPVEAVA